MSNDPLLMQLKRIRGQIDGIIAMYESDQSCVNVVHQVLAARNSLGSVTRKLLFDKANRCTKERNVAELDEILKEAFRN
jgi:CsoR family transcriptional regulator, copper-sensing transcriptional repressor